LPQQSYVRISRISQIYHLGPTLGPLGVGVAFPSLIQHSHLFDPDLVSSDPYSFLSGPPPPPLSGVLAIPLFSPSSRKLTVHRRLCTALWLSFGLDKPAQHLETSPCHLLEGAILGDLECQDLTGSPHWLCAYVAAESRGPATSAPRLCSSALVCSASILSASLQPHCHTLLVFLPLAQRHSVYRTFCSITYYHLDSTNQPKISKQACIHIGPQGEP
jgi:hypothetical protein